MVQLTLLLILLPRLWAHVQSFQFGTSLQFAEQIVGAWMLFVLGLGLLALATWFLLGRLLGE